MKAARTQCAMVLSTVNKNSVVHSIVHSTVSVHILVQQLQTPVVNMQCIKETLLKSDRVDESS